MLLILRISMSADLQTLVICSSMNRLLVCVTPRFLVCEEN